jgi:hypothetical protein
MEKQVRSIFKQGMAVQYSQNNHSNRSQIKL